MKNYYKAVRIAKSYAGPWYRDIVHSAYITYWNKYESNLFDEHEGTVLRYVKNQYGNFYRTYYKDIRLKERTGEIVQHEEIDYTDPQFELEYSQLPRPINIYKPIARKCVLRTPDWMRP